jgi:hypothetical protein
MLQTYRRAFNESFLQTGNEAIALDDAKRNVQRVYGVTRQHLDGSPRVVRRPIESQYSAIDGSHDWIRKQAADEIKAERGITVKPEDIWFEATPVTEQDISRGGMAHGHPPRYAVYWLKPADADGHRRTDTIAGRSFMPDLAAARQAATERVQSERDAGAPRLETLGGDLSTVRPRSEPDRPRNLLDLFGFGAPAGAQ